MEHVERSHPFRVSFGEVVIHSHHVDTLSGKRIEEYRQSRNESLTLTGSHLGNLSLMKNDTTDNLDIVVDHVPGNLVSASHPMVLPESLVSFNLHEITCRAEIAVEVICSHLDNRVLCESARRRLHDGKSLRKNLIENSLDFLILFLHKFI